MADANRSIHLVNSHQSQKPKQDPADIASQALALAKECSETLSALKDYSDMMTAQLSAELAQLEIVALRAIAQRGRRS